jgi:hypothetical protein
MVGLLAQTSPMVLARLWDPLTLSFAPTVVARLWESSPAVGLVREGSKRLGNGDDVRSGSAMATAYEASDDEFLMAKRGHQGKFV